MVSFLSLDRPIIHDIVSRHAEDATFLWQQRDRFVRAPHIYPDDLKNLE